ncbi:MAG TPA: DUF5652 family protein [Candidatus Woesearchaeota archaeon]|nr:DUF5652 family protein [Candidatus Woesearchaeota archaeon]
MITEIANWIWILTLPLLVWEVVWKGIGLWKSARRNQLVWYICILIFNTLGILPIIYLLFFQGKKETTKGSKK